MTHFCHTFSTFPPFKLFKSKAELQHICQQVNILYFYRAFKKKPGNFGKFSFPESRYSLKTIPGIREIEFSVTLNLYLAKIFDSSQTLQRLSSIS